MPITAENPFKWRHFPGQVILINIAEQVRRTVKKRIWLAKGAAQARFIGELFGIAASLKIKLQGTARYVARSTRFSQ